MWTPMPSFRFEIDNFSKNKAIIHSKPFVGGGCEWYFSVDPNSYNDPSSIGLCITTSLRTRWKRWARYYFVLFNQSEQVLYESPVDETSSLFCSGTRRWRYYTLPSKLQEQGFLENDKLIIEVYISVEEEALDGEKREDVSEKEESVDDINGFKAFASQVTSVKKIFAETEHVLSNACNKLSEIAELGSKMDWLKSKLDEVTLDMKKRGDDVSRVQQLEERVKNLEQMQLLFNRDFSKSKALEKKKLFDADRSPRVKNLEERVKNLEAMELGFKLECLKSKLDKVSMDGEKSDKLDMTLDDLKSKLDEHALESKDLKERIKNNALMLSNFKYKYDLEEVKSIDDDDFYLVDESA